MKSCRVFLVDDQAMFRQGLTRLLRDVEEIEVVGQASGGEEALRQTQDLRPDVVVIDADLLTSDETAFIDALRSESPEVKIVVLTAWDEDGEALAVGRMGVHGYVARSDPAARLIQSVLGTMDRNSAISQTAMHHLADGSVGGRTNDHRPIRSHGLSQREREVLRMVAAGADNQKIAEALNVSESTVRSHLHSVHSKLGLESRVQIALYALQQGIYP